MTSDITITATEELKRYYKKVNAKTKPIIDRVLPEDPTTESRRFMEDAEVKQIFDEDLDDDDNEWAVVTTSGEIPGEDHKDNHRIATGIGPIETATGTLQKKIIEGGSLLCDKATEGRVYVGECCKKGMEKTAEGIGRAAFSESAYRMVQRYPLLGRLASSFERGKEEAIRGRVDRSPRSYHAPAHRPDSQAEKPPVDPEIGELEDVPITDDDGYGLELIL